MVNSQTSIVLEPASIHIWRIDLDEPIADLTSVLSAEESMRANYRKLETERNRFIYAHGAKRCILANYLNVSSRELEFMQGDHGKPSLYQTNSNIEFNLTHCEDMALLAVADATPVGIDLERIRTRPLQLKIAQRIFSEHVFRQLEQLPSDKLDSAFLQHWTELEACIKCAGNGIFSNQNISKDITAKHFSPLDGWIACVAAKGVHISSMELKHFRYRN